MNTIEEKKEAFERLLNIMDELRVKCPWDKKQTFESLRTNTIEETYELADAIFKQDYKNIQKELGDVLLHIVFYSKIASELQLFDIKDVCDSLCDKLIFRHPHVFGEQKATNSEEALKYFKQSKNKEKKLKSKSEEIGHVPEDLPALIKVYKMYSQFEKMQPVYFNGEFKTYIKKVREELAELEEAYNNNDMENFEEELGDVLTTVVSLGHTKKIDSEIALNKSFKKVLNRISIMEEELLKADEKLDTITPETFKEYWKQAKTMEK
jgi:XTP/dITP diphosphohydrolase